MGWGGGGGCQRNEVPHTQNVQTHKFHVTLPTVFIYNTSHAKVSLEIGKQGPYLRKVLAKSQA